MGREGGEGEGERGKADGRRKVKERVGLGRVGKWIGGGERENEEGRGWEGRDGERLVKKGSGGSEREMERSGEGERKAKRLIVSNNQILHT